MIYNRHNTYYVKSDGFHLLGDIMMDVMVNKLLDGWEDTEDKKLLLQSAINYIQFYDAAGPEYFKCVKTALCILK